MGARAPGMHEFEVEALLLETFRKHGSERPAYGSIVGSGANATILHYRQNNRKMEEGELLLIDAGCEYDYYASDVTRTFPVGGKFTQEQQAIYELVLDAQVAGIEATRAGATLEEIHEKCVDVDHARPRRRSGSSRATSKELIEKEGLQAVLHAPHEPLARHGCARRRHLLRRRQAARARAGHGAHRRAGHLHRRRTTTRSPPKWRGIGVRIEDDILVTKEGRRT